MNVKYTSHAAQAQSRDAAALKRLDGKKHYAKGYPKQSSSCCLLVLAMVCAVVAYSVVFAELVA